jgi:hypothetical protein
MGNDNLDTQLKTDAINERGRIDGREAAEEDRDDSSMNLVGWMLW